ncbi:MAG: GMC family oxidoreductase N-terminal domain-containing protein [Bacteroidota bacterium]
MVYDYIIVGAGSAGCLMANRLSADPKNSVLLIEAGGPDTKPEIGIPGGYARLHRTKVDWNFNSEPQEHLLGRSLFLPRGKTLGGSSSTNAMAYVRGNPADFDDWASMGNAGWGYKDVLPLFKKHECNIDVRNEYHGQEGELNVIVPDTFPNTYAEPFMEACELAGIPRTDDYNSGQQEGVGPFQATIKNGRRHSSADAFLKPVMNRSNLTVLTHTQTTKVLLDGGKAIGVEVLNRQARKKTFSCRQEVVLCAGSFASPQLLMLSGIGHRGDLSDMGVDGIHHLPGVGQNLQDHLFCRVSALTKRQDAQNHHVPTWMQIKDTIYYLLTRKGILSTSPLSTAAFFNLLDPSGRVDCQFHFITCHLGDDYKADFHNLKTFPTTDGISIWPTLLRPKSRGYVKLRSTDVADQPIIQPNFLSQEEDRKLMIAGVKKAYTILQSDPLRPHLKSINAPLDVSSDEAIFEHIQKCVETVYHPVGTCKMGKDDMAVVDDQLRVHGINGLRVADASIMPTIVSGNTNAAVYMIAEKGADMILNPPSTSGS